jgi:hypothetical protein
MSGHEFGRLTVTGGLTHSFPERDGLAGIVSGASHVEEAHLVGFNFVIATEGEQNAVGRTRAEQTHDRLALLKIHIGKRKGSADQRGLNEGVLEDALGAVTGDGVRDFVADDRGEAGFRLRDREDAGVNDDLAAGQTERVYLLAVDDADLPIERGSGVARLRGDPGRDAPDRLCGGTALNDIRAGEDLLKRLEAERLLLLGGHRNALDAAGFRIRESFRAEKLKDNHDASDDERREFQT